MSIQSKPGFFLLRTPSTRERMILFEESYFLAYNSVRSFESQDFSEEHIAPGSTN
jgi:hypothetical protein